MKTRPFIALAVLVTSLIASAEGVAAEPTLDLLPYPQEVAVGPKWVVGETIWRRPS